MTQHEPDGDLTEVAKLIGALPDTVGEQRGLHRLEAALQRLRQDPAEQQRVQQIVDAVDDELPTQEDRILGAADARTTSTVHRPRLASRPAPRVADSSDRRSVFISYRSVDTLLGATGIHDALVREFGPDKVFRDCSSTAAGVHYPTAIQDALDSADVLVSVIGPRWHTLTDQTTGMRLIDRAHDWVRRELARAFQRNIPVLPVLLKATPDDAALPPVSALPDDIKQLALLQAFEVNQDRFSEDMDRLAAQLIRLTPVLARQVALIDRHAPTVAEFFEFVDMLEAIPCMRDAATRSALVGELRPAISAAIPYSPQSRIHVTNILRTCLNYTDGMTELLRLIAAMEDKDSEPLQQLATTAPPWAIPA